MEATRNVLVEKEKRKEKKVIITDIFELFKMITQHRAILRDIAENKYLTRINFCADEFSFTLDSENFRKLKVVIGKLKMMRLKTQKC